MRGFLGGLLGSKKKASQDCLDELIAELCGDGVSSKVWEDVIAFENLEDELESAPKREKLVVCLSTCADNIFALLHLCVDSIGGELAAKAGTFDEAAETRLANSLVILSYLLAATPPGTAQGFQTINPENEKQRREAGNIAFMERLWTVDDSRGRPLGECIADSILKCLFHDGFTVDLPPHDEEGDTRDSIDGVIPALLWAEGVGPEGSNQPAEDGVQSNRVVALQALIALISGGSPSADLEAADSAGASDQLARFLILDTRALRYLCEPQRTVPFRRELFYSLLSVALGYDPHGYGVPYGGYFAGAKQEAFAQLCLQALGLLLQDVQDATFSGGSLCVSQCLLVTRPQEQLFPKKALAENDLPASHFFRELLLSISTEREVSFMMDGVASLLGTVGKERGSYLPSSLRLPPFLPEVLLLVLHLTASRPVIEYACEQEEIANLLEGVLQAACQTPEHVSENALSAVEAAILLNLTAYREVCIELDEDFEGGLPDDLPDFEGSGADLVALAALTQASESIGKCKGSSFHRSIIEMNLATFANLSIFADGFCVEVTSRIFSIFDRCAKAAQVVRGRDGLAIFLPILLEAFNNVLQYKYVPNVNLAYGLMTRHAQFKEMASLISQELEKASRLDPSSDNQQWLMDLQTHLHVITVLLDVTVPMLEAEVSKKDISSSDEAKDLLPRCILGLMPPPHAFQLRSLLPCAFTHFGCEHVLAASVGNGPLAPLWEVEEDSELQDDETQPQAFEVRARRAEDDKKKRHGTARERSSSSRATDRSSSRSRGIRRANGSSSHGDDKLSSPGRQTATVEARAEEPANSSEPSAPARGAVSSSPGMGFQAEAGNPANEAEATKPVVQDKSAGLTDALPEAIKAQLEAAAAAGLDIKSLLQSLQPTEAS
eukprot:TRINITY_DN22839_c0_g1_i1.p1 TRINITY_DN22839_c0_g1~~TRINITY_DN22839_c0_g1_i1.p1  ORF type:complete len:895 (-),score=202.07 TRINITY_DN22839_c0_g1_i1:192-2876(-)